MHFHRSTLGPRSPFLPLAAAAVLPTFRQQLAERSLGPHQIGRGLPLDVIKLDVSFGTIPLETCRLLNMQVEGHGRASSSVLLALENPCSLSRQCLVERLCGRRAGISARISLLLSCLCSSASKELSYHFCAWLTCYCLSGRWVDLE